MGYQPQVFVPPCPNCGGKPRERFRSMFSNRVRMECSCGVAGAWKFWVGDGEPWNVAASGWGAVAGIPAALPPAPLKR